jgi:hypothetical protein
MIFLNDDGFCLSILCILRILDLIFIFYQEGMLA